MGTGHCGKGVVGEEEGTGLCIGAVPGLQAGEMRRS